MNEKKIEKLTKGEIAEHSLITTYKFRIWRMFTKALKVYDLLHENDMVFTDSSNNLLYFFPAIKNTNRKFILSWNYVK